MTPGSGFPTSRRRFLAGAAATASTVGVAACTDPAGDPAALGSADAATGRTVLLSDRQGFNRRWFASNLERVHVPESIDELATHVTDAIRDYGRDVKVVAGRHCYENFAYNGETKAIIDLAAMNTVGFDPERGAWFVDAGCALWDAYREMLTEDGLVLPAGSCSSVGAGGHISGGGYGLLSRLHGLVIDHVTGIDVVTWDDRQRTATLRYVSDDSSDADERDLFWALRGAGGGNFGVIARYWFADPPPAPEQASIWTLAWDWETLDTATFTALVREHDALVPELPDNAFSLFKLNHVAAKQVALIVQVASPPGADPVVHERTVDTIVSRTQRRLAAVATPTSLRGNVPGHPTFTRVPPTSESAQHLTFLEAVQTLNGTGANQFGKYKSAYARTGFSDAQIAALDEWLRRTPPGLQPDAMAQSLVQVDSFGGAVNRVAPDATAYPHRSSTFALQYQTYWNNDSLPGRDDGFPYRQQSDAHLGWISGFYGAVYADTGGLPPANQDGGCYSNYPDSDLGTHATGDVDRALERYFLDNFRANERNLVAIKRRWDPTDVFHHAQSIPVE